MYTNLDGAQFDMRSTSSPETPEEIQQHLRKFGNFRKQFNKDQQTIHLINDNSSEQPPVQNKMPITFDDAVKQLNRMFPELDRTTVSEALIKKNGHMEKAVTTLLRLTARENHQNTVVMLPTPGGPTPGGPNGHTYRGTQAETPQRKKRNKKRRKHSNQNSYANPQNGYGWKPPEQSSSRHRSHRHSKGSFNNEQDSYNAPTQLYKKHRRKKKDKSKREDPARTIEPYNCYEVLLKTPLRMERRTNSE
eukprot:UN33439